MKTLDLRDLPGDWAAEQQHVGRGWVGHQVKPDRGGGGFQTVSCPGGEPAWRGQQTDCRVRPQQGHRPAERDQVAACRRGHGHNSRKTLYIVGSGPVVPDDLTRGLFGHDPG